MTSDSTHLEFWAFLWEFSLAGTVSANQTNLSNCNLAEISFEFLKCQSESLKANFASGLTFWQLFVTFFSLTQCFGMGWNVVLKDIRKRSPSNKQKQLLFKKCCLYSFRILSQDVMNFWICSSVPDIHDTWSWSSERGRGCSKLLEFSFYFKAETNKNTYESFILLAGQTRRYLQTPLRLPDFFPIGQWNRFK